MSNTSDTATPPPVVPAPEIERVEPAEAAKAPEPTPAIFQRPSQPAKPAAKKPAKAKPAATAPPAEALRPIAERQHEDLLARISALEEENAELRAAQAGDDEADGITLAAAASPPEPKRWLVSVKYAVPWVVEAVDAANAYEEYKRAIGLLSTDYQPEISLCAPETPLGRPAKAA